MLQVNNKMYSAANDPRPQMITRPEMIPKLDRKWSPTWTANDPLRKKANGMDFGFLDLFLNFHQLKKN